MQSFVPLVLNALTYISIVALVAVGLAIVFGMMDIINMAHGEFIAIGAYTVATTQSIAGAGHSEAAFWIGLAMAPLMGAIGGLVLETLVIRPLYHRTLDTLLATFAISLMAQKALELVFGPQPQLVSAPLSGAVPVLGESYPSYRLFIIVAVVLTRLQQEVSSYSTSFWPLIAGSLFLTLILFAPEGVPGLLRRAKAALWWRGTESEAARHG